MIRPAVRVRAVVFDVGNVLYDWDIRHLYRKLIADPEDLDWFVGAGIRFVDDDIKSVLGAASLKK